MTNTTSRQRIIALRQNDDAIANLPSLVFRRSLASLALVIWNYMNDILFLMACVVTIGFLFPTVDNSFHVEIEQARKELQMDLIRVTLNQIQHH